MIAALSPTNLAYCRLILRGLQFVCSLFAMAFAAAGFYGGNSTHSTTFVLLMGYTGMLYSLWHIVCVELFHVANRPALRLEQAVDAVLVIALLVAGICLAAANYVQHCGDYDYVSGIIHCSNLKTAVAFDFIAMFFFLVSLGLSFVAPAEASHGLTDVQVEEPVPYRQEATPTSGALSPIGNQNGPAAKV